MHELSIALSIIDVASEQAEKHGGASVTAVHLKLGPLAGVIKEALLSAWEMARENTPLEHAELLIQDVPVVVQCSYCLAERTPISIQDMRCSVCQAPTPQIIHGREMEVSAMEICDEPPLSSKVPATG